MGHSSGTQVVDDHEEGVKKINFCTLRTSPDQKCQPCGHNYRTNSKPGTLADKTFIQGRSKKVEKGYEAHHLICVASVTQFIAKSANILSVVKQTKWCVNDEPNMYAMPLWGHTIKYYVDLETAGISLGDRFKKPTSGPTFQNIPMHDYDHNSKKGYKKNHVDKSMKKLAKRVEKKKEEDHQAAVDDLKSVLDSLSSAFRSLLQGNGMRVGGTHAAWQKGSKEPNSDWYLPFSMASKANAEVRTFPSPGFGGKAAAKIQRLVAAFGKWS